MIRWQARDQGYSIMKAAVITSVVTAASLHLFCNLV